MGRFVSPDPMGFLDGPNPYVFAKNAPSGFVDPDGELAFTIAGVLVATGGVFGGIFEVAAELQKPGDATFGDLAGAFGRGFLSGAAGTGAALALKNPYAGGAVAGATANVLNSALTGEWSFLDLGFEVGVNSVTAGRVSRLPGLKLQGPRPHLLKVRTAFNRLGKNSFRLFGQEVVQDVGVGILHNFWEAFRAGISSPRAPTSQSRKPLWKR